MKNNEEKNVLQNNGEYFVIHKETVVNYFFTSILVLALGTFLALFLMGAIKMATSNDEGIINTDLVGWYTDEFLNMSYPVPNSDTWFGVEIDTTEISTVADESKGDDEYFSIDDDALTAEVISFLCFNQDEADGYREFMSFTFAPDFGYSGETFIQYCEEKFKKDMSEAGELVSYTLTGTTQDEYGGVMMDMTVVQNVQQENEDGTITETTATTYYVQYVKKVGKNIGYITYGSVMDDETVKPYLQFFLNNVITEKSTMS